ncbi:MAG: LD-carboxypeptidase [Bacteroidia bacterium]|jgi:muramoyltetrapeptide carboxypeptidase|nr:LD-carboxypeptidase [Bacteroidia bacterium]
MSHLTSPEWLKPGDEVAIVATARKVSKEEMMPAINIFTEWGLTVRVDDDLYADENQFAGNDKLRAAALNRVLANEKIKAVFIARGGYGTVRMVDLVDWDLLRKNPKWIIGFSDITVLHSHIHQHLQLCTIHAPMPINLQPHLVNIKVVHALKENLLTGICRYPDIVKHALNRSGKGEGVLIGGNLSVLYSLLGSSSDVDTNGKILFIEDLDEYLYHIDRMIMALKRAGKLSGLAGLVVGGMSDMKDNTIPFGQSAEQIIADAVKEYSFPVLFNFPAGHLPDNYPLVFGRKYQLTIYKEHEILLML